MPSRSHVPKGVERFKDYFINHHLMLLVYMKRSQDFSIKRETVEIIFLFEHEKFKRSTS